MSYISFANRTSMESCGILNSCTVSFSTWATILPTHRGFKFTRNFCSQVANLRVRLVGRMKKCEDRKLEGNEKVGG